jgi:hypothetical protein
VKKTRELRFGWTVHFDSPDRETQTIPLWHQQGAKNAPTAVRAMWESDCCGSLHRNQPSANRVTKSAYFSLSMIFANQSATITGPMIKSAVIRSLPDCCGSAPRDLVYLLQRNDIQPHKNLALCASVNRRGE